MLKVTWGWQQGRGWLALQCCLTRRRQIAEDMPVLLLERCHHRHHGLNNTRTVGTLCPKTAFAPEDPWTDRPLCRIVRRLNLGVAHERPQRLAPLEQLSAGSFGLGHPTGLACC